MRSSDGGGGVGNTIRTLIFVIKQWNATSSRLVSPSNGAERWTRSFCLVLEIEFVKLDLCSLRIHASYKLNSSTNCKGLHGYRTHNGDSLFSFEVKWVRTYDTLILDKGYSVIYSISYQFFLSPSTSLCVSLLNSEKIERSCCFSSLFFCKYKIQWFDAHWQLTQ